jgi:hypothetical protein
MKGRPGDRLTRVKSANLESVKARALLATLTQPLKRKNAFANAATRQAVLLVDLFPWAGRRNSCFSPANNTPCGPES